MPSDIEVSKHIEVSKAYELTRKGVLRFVSRNEKMKQIRERMKHIFWCLATKKLDGIGIIEIILILVIIIGLVLIFRNQIEAIVKNAFQSITGDATNIQKDISIN